MDNKNISSRLKLQACSAIDIERLAYIRDMAEQLAKMARDSHDDELAYLLDMATRAAAEQVPKSQRH